MNTQMTEQERLEFAKALDLPADATEEAIASAIDETRRGLETMCSRLGVATVPEALARVRTLRESAKRADELESRMAELEVRDVEREREALISAHSDPERPGCVITPGMLSWAQSLDLPTLRSYLEVAAPLNVRPNASLPQPPIVEQLTPDQRKAAENAGVTDRQFAAELRRIRTGE